jgi:hypothetical protein
MRNKPQVGLKSENSKKPGLLTGLILLSSEIVGNSVFVWHSRIFGHFLKLTGSSPVGHRDNI